MRLIYEMSVSSSQKSSFEPEIATIKFWKKPGVDFGGSGPGSFPYLSTTPVDLHSTRGDYLIHKKSITLF